MSQQAGGQRFPNATTMRWEAAPLLYGQGATAEIGYELKRLGIGRPTRNHDPAHELS